jgi:arabinofuranosyltransferase
VLVLYAWTFLPFISDDALISLRYSERLLDGDGLTWTDGERVEGYSNLLWVLGVAGMAPLVGGDLVQSARALGVLAMASVVGALFHAFWPRRPRELLAPTAAALLLACCAPVTVWSIGGLEQPLVAACLAWSLALALPLADASAPCPARRVLCAGVPLALLCITRPDGALFAFAIGLGLWLARPMRASSQVLVLWILPAVFVVGQLVFRLAYYGAWVPNSALAKVSLSAHHFLAGLRYVASGARAIPVLPVAALMAFVLLRARARRPRMLVLLAPGLLWAAYVAGVGGDIFPAYRHLVPLVVVAAFIVAEAASRSPSSWRGVPVGALALLLVPLTYRAAHHHPEVERARTERWEWMGQIVGEFLRRGFASRSPLIAVDSAGCIPFFSKLPALDLLGLNDRFLATHPPPDFGRGWLGHELGNGEYVLGRKPDLVLLGGPRGPVPLGSEQGCFRSGEEMVAAPGFKTDYAKVIFETPPPRSLQGMIWVRRYGRVGLREDPGRIAVPGLLFSANPETVVRADRDGAIEAKVDPARPARLEALRVAAGTWHVEVRASGPVRVRVTRADHIVLAEGVPPLELALAESGELGIEVHALAPELGLAELVLQERASRP